MEDEDVASGTKFVWHNPKISFGPVFMEVVRPKRRYPGHVHLRCIGPDGKPFERLKVQKLPIPPFFQERDWTEEDVKKSVAELEGKRTCARDTTTGKVPNESK